MSVPSAIQFLAVDPVTPTTLYAAASTSVFKSTNEGTTWNPLPALIPAVGGTADPRVLAIDPLAPATVYVGATRGLFKSINGGANWQQIFPTGGVVISFQKLSISRSNPAILLVATNTGTLNKTMDGGNNWSALAFPLSANAITALSFDPTNANVIYAATNGSGVYKTTDGGATWVQSNNGLNSNFVSSLAIPPNLPTTVYAGTYVGQDAFVAKLNAAGTALVYSTYLGGGNVESGQSIAVDTAGNAHITGSTQSPNFPRANAYQTTLNGASDVFVTKLNPAGSALVWSTYLGGSGAETIGTLAINAAGNVFVAGQTTSTNFPTASAFQNTNRSAAPSTADAFVTRFSADGSKLDYSTYLGGSGLDVATAIAVDGAGNAYVTGYTDSLDFPVLGAIQATRKGEPTVPITDAYVTKLNASGNGLGYSTYLGGAFNDIGTAIAVDAAGSAYVAGNASSNDFPTTPNSLKQTGSNDGFVAKLALNADLAVRLSDLPDPVMAGNQLTYTLTVTNTGPDVATGVTATDTLPTGVTLVSASTTQGSCNNASPITCNLGALAANAKAVITIVVTPAAAGTITNRASVSSATPDLQTANNTATQETKVSTLPSIFGQVRLGNEGLSGVTVALAGAPRPAVTTDVEGAYQFGELPAGGNYTVTPARQGFVFNPPNRTFNNLSRDQRGDFAAVACVFSIAPRSRSFTATGGTGELVVTSPDAQCPWTARSDADWIRITSVTTGTGNATVTFAVAPTVGSRIGTITVAGHVFTVQQEFYPCSATEFRQPQLIPLTGSFFDQVFPRVVVNDFNGDGRPDPAFLLSFDQKGVAVTLSNNQGGYGAALKLLTDGDYQSLHTADFNGDGKADLAATTNLNNGQVVVLLGNGTGGFAAPVRYATGPQPEGVTSADLNGDGRLDLAVATASLSGQSPSTDQNVSLLFGTAAGGFSAAQNISVPLPAARLVKVEAADFTGDNKLDLLLLNYVGEVLLLPGNGNGTFAEPRRTSTQVVFGWFEVGDFNGDSKNDFVLVRRDSSEIRVYLNNGTGSFGAPVMGQAHFPPGAIAAADFNRDGKTDLALTHPDGFSVYYATTGGNFAAPVSFFAGGVVIPGFGTTPLSSLATGDFNRDGRPDLFVPTFYNVVDNGYPVALAVVNATVNGFAAPRNFTYTPTERSFNFGQLSAAAGDINGDGVIDLAIAASTEIFVLVGNGRGEFGAPQAYAAGQDPQSLTLRDFNGDGRLDALVLNPTSDAMTLLLNNGTGGFAEGRRIAVGSNPRALGVADFNGDGRLDVLTKSPQGGLGIFSGNGQGGFTETSSGIGQEINDPTFITGDFNGDARMDVALTAFGAFSCLGSYPMIVLAGNGNGGFSKSGTITLPADVAYPTSADLNGDGRTDLLYSSVCPNTQGLYVALADGNGGFNAAVKYEAGVEPRALSTGDLNGDGKLDVIAATTRGGSIFGNAVFLLGKGDGTLNAAAPLSTGQTPVVLIPADFNEDGANDLAVIRVANNTLGVFTNSALCLTANSNVITSAASFTRFVVAKESIAALFGANLATETQIATLTPLPTTLANVRVRLTDNAGVQRFTPLFFASPAQINCLIPPDAPLGTMLVQVLRGNDVVSTGVLRIAQVNPGLFSADASGSGLAAAVVLRVKADGRQLFELAARFDVAQNRFVPIPIDLSDPTDQVFLLLFGSGLRNRSSAAGVNLRIGGLSVVPQYAGAQGSLVGLDQINAPLPRALAGRGDVDILLTVDGKAANLVKVRIQ